MPSFSNPPQDPTRVEVNPSNPPDQSVYSNPLTSNQYTSRNPGSSQVGAQPNGQLSSPNTLPTDTVPVSD